MTIEVLRRISLKRAIALITEDDPEIRRQIVKALRVIYDATDGVFLGYGRTRMTFLDPGKDVVWKVPRSLYGVDDNLEEDTCPFNPEILPIRELFYIHDVPVMMMEYVEYLPEDWCESDETRWVDAIDCMQVGYTKDGRLVTYDFGHDWPGYWA